jgi:hypothetical protein
MSRSDSPSASGCKVADKPFRLRSEKLAYPPVFDLYREIAPKPEPRPVRQSLRGLEPENKIAYRQFVANCENLRKVKIA